MNASTNTGSETKSNDNRSKVYSIRLSDTEYSKIRGIARRLSATDTALIRFAILSMLARLAPLHDTDTKGLSLIPVFVECGAELTSYFDLDDTKIGMIINGGIDSPSSRVDQDDLMLLAMAGLDEPRVHAKLREMQPDSAQSEPVASALRTYFYEKYIYQNPPGKSGS